MRVIACDRHVKQLFTCKAVVLHLPSCGLIALVFWWLFEGTNLTYIPLLLDNYIISARDADAENVIQTMNTVLQYENPAKSYNAQINMAYPQHQF